MSDKIKKNPLNVILGTYLKRERNDLGLSSASVAEELKLGDSIYRMIEAGSASLNINRLSLLVAIFKNSRIKLERLAKYLISVAVLDFELDQGKTLINALEILGERDEDIEYFINKTRPLYKHEYGSNEFKNVLDKVAVKELDAFLGNESYRGKGTRDFKGEAIDALLGVPSIEMPNILTFLRSLRDRQPLHVGPTAKEWEDINKEQFRFSYGLYRRADIIMDDENLEMFSYDYLLQVKFSGLQMIFVEDKISPESLRKSFISKLQKIRVKYRRPLLEEVHLTRIKFKTVKKLNEPMSLLIDYRQDIFGKLSAYWNFTHDYGIETGFVGGAEKSRNFAINLTYKESLKRVTIFKDVWNSI